MFVFGFELLFRFLSAALNKFKRKQTRKVTLINGNGNFWLCRCLLLQNKPSPKKSERWFAVTSFDKVGRLLNLSYSVWNWFHNRQARQCSVVCQKSAYTSPKHTSKANTQRCEKLFIKISQPRPIKCYWYIIDIN